MQSLQLHLTGAAQSWLGKLKKETIGSWDELAKQFQVNLQKASINRGTQSFHPKIRGDTTIIYTTLKYNQKLS
jgi:hypothetical protein